MFSVELCRHGLYLISNIKLLWKGSFIWQVLNKFKNINYRDNVLTFYLTRPIFSATDMRPDAKWAIFRVKFPTSSHAKSFIQLQAVFSDYHWLTVILIVPLHFDVLLWYFQKRRCTIKYVATGHAFHLDLFTLQPVLATIIKIPL